MDDVVIVAAVRTPIGRMGGPLSGLPAAELGARVIGTLLERGGVGRDMVDEVVLGQVLTAGCGQNPARQAVIRAGLPDAIPAMTINMVCGSGLKAVHLAAQAIACGDAEIAVAGGQESMSLAPYLLPRAGKGFPMDAALVDAALTDTVLHDGLQDAFHHYHMGTTAENIARRYGISREEQDDFALHSQHKAEAAQQAGRFRDEIFPVELSDGACYDADATIRQGMTAAVLASLRPAFVEGGTVTAGNASGLNDGAAAVLLMSGSKARTLGLEPLAKIRAGASAGVAPALMGIGPVPAIRRCLQKTGWRPEELDLIELNEAFAAQAIAVHREIGWQAERVNVNGGAIALGHPIGASGCRILVTLLHEMRRRDARRGLASLCIGGGMGIALTVER